MAKVLEGAVQAGTAPSPAAPGANRWRPVPIGLGILLVLTSLVLVSQAMLGRVPFGPAGDLAAFWGILVHIPVNAYLPAAYLGVIAGARRRLVQIQPLRGDAAEVPMCIPPVGRVTLGWVVAGVLGASLGVVGPYLTEPFRHTLLGFWNPGSWAPEVVWHRALGLMAGTWIGWFSFAVVRSAVAFSHAARDLTEIDIFDLSPLRPFTQQALANGLFAAGMMSLLALFGIGRGVTPMLMVSMGISVALVATALLMPLLGVHRRIREARLRQLTWCDAAIARERSLVRESGEGSGRLADLLAFRTLAERVTEWPIDMPALRLMALYLLIPLGSWIASAIVQHTIESALRTP